MKKRQRTSKRLKVNVSLIKCAFLASSLMRMSVSVTLLREPRLLSASDLAVVVNSVLLPSTAGSLSPVAVPGRRSMQFVLKTHLYYKEDTYHGTIRRGRAVREPICGRSSRTNRHIVSYQPIGHGYILLRLCIGQNHAPFS